MRKKIGREVALLCLPVVFFGIAGLCVRVAWPKTPLKAVLIERWVPNDAPVNYFRVHLTIEWNRSWFKRNSTLAIHSQSRLLDADGHLVATQSGYGFNQDREISNHWIFDPGMSPTRFSKGRWKEPLTFQTVFRINEEAPLEVNCHLPDINRSEKPRPSKFPMSEKGITGF